MPINIIDPVTGITKSHIAERLEINLLFAKEDVKEMQVKVYFNIDTLLGETKVAETYWDRKALVFDCKNNPRLEAAMAVIQEEIGIRRYEQITTPAPTQNENESAIPPEV